MPAKKEPESSKQERLRQERLRIDTKVKYKVIQRKAADGLVEGFRPDGRSVNISLHGLSIVTEEAVKKGDYLKLELGLPGGAQAIRALTEVVWAKEEAGRHVCGIRFLILLNQADDASIRRFIREHPEDSAA